MATKLLIEKYVSENSEVYNIGTSKCASRHSVVVPKQDVAGFLYYILPSVRTKSFDDYPYGDSIAMAMKLALDNGKKYITFNNMDEPMKATIAKMVKDGILKEEWDNYEIVKTLPAPIVESFSVRSLD
jgi:hypothetical protein